MLIKKYASSGELLCAEFAYAMITSIAASQKKRSGAVSVMLCGGRTPGPFYRRLASASLGDDSVNWLRVVFFMGDERDVPLSSGDSNYKNAVGSLCVNSKISASSIMPVDVSSPSPREAAAKYNAEILKAKAGFKRSGECAADILVLGLGEDCHTASLFPRSFFYDSAGAHGVRDESAFISHFVPSINSIRYTITPEVILAAPVIFLLASGAAKKKALAEIEDPRSSYSEAPGRLIYADPFGVKKELFVFAGDR